MVELGRAKPAAVQERKASFPSASRNKLSNANDPRKKGRKKLREASEYQWVGALIGGNRLNTGGRQNSSEVERSPNMHHDLVSFLDTKNRKRDLKRKGREVNRQLLAPLSWRK